MPSAGGKGPEAEGRQGSIDGMPRGRGAVRHEVGVGECGAGRERFTAGVARVVEPSCHTTRKRLGRRSRTRPLVGTQHLDLTKSRLRPAMHAEIRFAFVKKMDRFFRNSHAHSSSCMQGGRTWFQASISQQSTPRVCDALGLRKNNVRRGMAGRARERGAGLAALVSRRSAKPGRRVRVRTLEPVWSTGSEKGDGRAFGARMGRLSRPSLLSRFRTTGVLQKPYRESAGASRTP